MKRKCSVTPVSHLSNERHNVGDAHEGDSGSRGRECVDSQTERWKSQSIKTEKVVGGMVVSTTENRLLCEIRRWR